MKITEMLIKNLPASECHKITQRSDITVFIENPCEPTDQLLELKELTKLTSYIIRV